MRTKALILGAAFIAAGVVSTMAQVYSANAVGYVNLTLPAGFSIIANPLNGTNNHLNTIMPLPDTADGVSIYRFKPDEQNYGDQIQFYAGFGWYSASGGDPWLTVNPGEGFFFQNTLGAPLNVTFVGEVPQGQLNVDIRGQNNFSILASQVPQALPIGAVGSAGTLEFPAVEGDTVFLYDGAAQDYKQAYQYYAGFGWYSANPDDPGVNGPIIPVASGFFVQKAGENAVYHWARNFSVN